MAFTADGRTYLVVLARSLSRPTSARLQVRGQVGAVECAPCALPPAARRVPVPAWDRGWMVLGAGQGEPVLVAEVRGDSWVVDLLSRGPAPPSPPRYVLASTMTAMADRTSGLACAAVEPGGGRAAQPGHVLAVVHQGRVRVPVARPRAFSWAVFLAGPAAAVVVSRSPSQLPARASLPPHAAAAVLSPTALMLRGLDAGITPSAWTRVRNGEGSAPAVVQGSMAIATGVRRHAFPLRVVRAEDGVVCWRSDLVTWPERVRCVVARVPFQLRTADGSTLMAAAPGTTRPQPLRSSALAHALSEVVASSIDAREAVVDFDAQEAYWSVTSLAEGPLGPSWCALMDRKLARFDGRTVTVVGFPDDIRGYDLGKLPAVIRRGDVIRTRGVALPVSRYLVPTGGVRAMTVTMDAPEVLTIGGQTVIVRDCMDEIRWWKDGTVHTISTPHIPKLPFQLRLDDAPDAIQLIRDDVPYEVFPLL